MTPMIFDALLALVFAAYAMIGYRRGLVLTAFSAVGFLVGAGLALWLLPGPIANFTAQAHSGLLAAPWAGPLLLVVGLFVLGTIGQSLLTRLAWPLRRGLHRGGIGPLDDVLGSVLTVLVVITIAWFGAGLLRGAAPNTVGATISQSQVLSAIDRAMPPQSDRLLGRVLLTLDRYGVPRAFDGIRAEPIVPVDPADEAAANTPAIQGVVDSVWQVDALALACGRSQEGSGWVAGPGLVVTNAHVVAGAEQVTLVHGVRRVSAEVVAFDPDRDLAVLSANLPASARVLPLGDALSHGDSAVVAGYPGGGPYRVQAARVRGEVNARGDDIYGRSGVTRELYALRAGVRPGNSGGPLLRTDGSVAGVIFARSLDDPQTAYALTNNELEPVLAQARAASAPVGTGRCAA
ncbi:S1-C subfamily serine protease [Kineosphaera limosa]|uniref:Putative peptidase S1 family protein n=1 Tax=Kineosphaera limosa NBRC 100340 TaxID=1184609 RepID=K6VM29_9MICO|nr:MarP family serine protease [Kineosphaera limosa]NYE00175.1 S1-C subfamily serine protease [Kineosphaera limosa]GAB97273.1 putative peptidase S1 family protein [Kineosphaera limosa NBRC 100340]